MVGGSLYGKTLRRPGRPRRRRRAVRVLDRPRESGAQGKAPLAGVRNSDSRRIQATEGRDQQKPDKAPTRPRPSTIADVTKRVVSRHLPSCLWRCLSAEGSGTASPADQNPPPPGRNSLSSQATRQASKRTLYDRIEERSATLPPTWAVCGTSTYATSSRNAGSGKSSGSKCTYVARVNAGEC